MPRIAEIQNRMAQLEDELAAITASGEVTPEDAQRAAVLEGRLNETRDNLIAEAAAVQRENERLALDAAANPQEAVASAAELVFGTRDAFTGIEPGWRNVVSANALREAQFLVRNAVSGLTTPQRYDYDLPQPIRPIMGFLDTIPRGMTDGDEHYFKSPVLTNAAAGWVSGDKPESSISWSPAVAHIETIAHQMPIAKQTARRYHQLENTVISALLLGLDIVENRYALTGSNSSGIVGARNQEGVLQYTKQADDKFVTDIALEMAMRCRIATGFQPDYIVMSPYTATSMRKAKDKNDRYMYPELVHDGKIAGMTVVEDMEMITTETSGTGESATTTIKNALGVYFSGASQWNTADEDEITIGLIDKQFIQNAYTILAEGTHAYKMTFPGAFCFCEEV